MDIDREQTLTVGISTTALFDLSEADAVFREQGITAYRDHMRAREREPLAPGTGMPLVQALLALNRHAAPGDPALVEVVVMSRNSPDTGARIARAVRERGLGVTRYAFTGGEPLSPYVSAFGLDLFLSKSERDVQEVIDHSPCAAAVLYPPPEGYEPRRDQVRIAFDADAVLFDEASEVVFKTRGLDAFYDTEDAATDGPMAEGPHAGFLKALARLQHRLPDPVEYSPVRIAIVTARDAPAELRVIETLRRWGVYVDAAFFLGGLEKGPVLQALHPHIFFDDQDRHLAGASRLVPSGRVPYRPGSPLRAAAPPPSEEPLLSRSPADCAPPLRVLPGE
jgi:5'-nucleotidase